jgi:hypothetical protein
MEVLVQPENNKIMMRVFAFAIVIGLLASCRATKKIQTAIAKKDTTETISIPNPKADTVQLIKDALSRLDSNKLAFNTFSAKVDIDYSDASNKKYDVNANIRMIKDSVIWVSISAILGIEAMRALITKDSVFLLNKLDKTFTSRSVDYLQEVTALPLGLSTLQNLIIGNVVFLDSNIVSYSINNNNNSISLLSMGRYFRNLITLNEGDKTLINSKLDDVDMVRNRTANLSYSDYENKRGPLFSTKRKISVSEKKGLNIALNFRQYDFNQDVNFPFSVPKNYKHK